MKTSNVIIGAVVGAGCLVMLCAGVGVIGMVGLFTARTVTVPITSTTPDLDQAQELELQVEDYADARKSFQTKLWKVGPSPQPAPTNLQLPATIQEVKYQSGDLSLTAYVDVAPGDNSRRPAVLFLHGGFALDETDLQMPQAYRDAGFIVMLPLLRGENGQPGNFTLCYDEVDDVLAAADVLAALPYVDSDRMFIAGHSVGGVLTQLAAMASKRFVGAASFSGLCNQHFQTDMSVIRFDASDDVEYRMRSSLAYASSFKCPIRLYYGTQEGWLVQQTNETVQRALQAGVNIAAVAIPGDHQSSVPSGIRSSIEFFQTLAK
ncbi:MAG: alpha/beta fold hydrolase [Planctomycetes bacterium]|nr:alpha/beta fold hydrolase [Planctomycetota bacterium]